MVQADFHMHSNYSDGSETPEALVKLAKKAGLDAIGITDHDTCGHFNRVQAPADLRVLYGIEISAMDPKTGIKAHVLGYHIQQTGLVSAWIAPLLEARHRNTLEQMNRLEAMGFVFDLDAMPRTQENYFYKQHVMAYLVKTGQASDLFGSFYQKTFRNGGPCHIDIAYPDVREAVAVIREAGGLAVLAHSGQQQNFYLIPELVALGLSGLEYNHYSHGPADLKRIKEEADTWHLFLTGGSDYHGAYGRIETLPGQYLSEPSGVQALL